MPGESLGMTPHSLLCVGVHEGGLRIYELSRMADGHVPQQVDVPAPLIGEHEAFRITVSLDDGHERLLGAVGNDLQKTLSALARDTAQHPLLAEHGFIPFGNAGERAWTKAYGQTPQNAIEFLARPAVYAQDGGQIRSRHASAQAEETQSHAPLLITQLTAALGCPCTQCENLRTVRTLEALSALTIFAETMRTRSATEPAENSPCRHNEWERRSRSQTLHLLPTHFCPTPNISFESFGLVFATIRILKIGVLFNGLRRAAVLTPFAIGVREWSG